VVTHRRVGPGTEADAESARMVAELDEVMAAALTPVAPAPRVLRTLRAEIEQPPLRYAPFFTRLAELFDISEDAAMAECARLAEPSEWRSAGWPGIRDMHVRGGPRVAGAEVLFACFTPGLRFPRHTHTGPEQVLVLEGSYIDSDGSLHAPGALQTSEPGSCHGQVVTRGQPCIVAAVVFGRRFEALPLRLLARAMGR
jgi:hypothetical protein